MIRLAHFVTHPIQYFAPLYRDLARSSDVELTVFFGSRHGVQPSLDRGFGQVIQFDVPLLEGYEHVFVENRGSGEPTGRRGNFDCPTLKQHLAQGRFQALWIHGWGYRAQWQAVRAARELDIPYLMRGETTPQTAGGNFLRRLVRQVWVGRMLRRAARCLYVGTHNRAFYRQFGVRDERLVPAHYSVDGRAFARAAAAADRLQVRREFGVQPAHFLIVTAAKAVQRKRLDDVIRAVGRLDDRARLWILGDGPERPQLESLSQASAPGKTTWHGFVNQQRLPALLGAADAFVLASEEETWGLAVNEAMACAVPAVCADRVGCAVDLVREGKTGFVYPTGSVKELTDRFQRLQQVPDQARRMGLAAQELVLQEYDVATTASQIVAAVRALPLSGPRD